MTDPSTEEDVTPIPPSQIDEDVTGSRIEYTDIPLENGSFWATPPKLCRGEALLALTASEAGTATRLCLDLLVDHWRAVVFGPCIEGAVFELKQVKRPEKVSMLDGYLTLFFDESRGAHFHLCTDVHRGLGSQGVNPEVARRRQCSRAAFYRTFGANRCSPGSWGIRLWNGDDVQMCSFFLPSPFLNDEQKRQKPDWSRLALWNDLRARYLGEVTPQPIPEDQTPPAHG
ncbi:MAG: hypothetical protein AAFV53_22150 [Myxococcota bacterium]